MGYEAGETGRARNDASQLGKLTRAPRTGAYPLIEWGWNRRDCEQFIYDILGVWWPKSACVQCPFALCSAAGRARVLDNYEAEPESGVRALILEHVAVAFNPRQTLAPKIRLLDLLVQTGRHHAALARYDEELTRLPWHIFEVRRAITAKRDGSGKKGRTVRSVQTVATTTRDGGPAELAAAADGRRGQAGHRRRHHAGLDPPPRKRRSHRRAPPGGLPRHPPRAVRQGRARVRPGVARSTWRPLARTPCCRSTGLADPGAPAATGGSTRLRSPGPMPKGGNIGLSKGLGGTPGTRTANDTRRSPACAGPPGGGDEPAPIHAAARGRPHRRSPPGLGWRR